MDRRTAILDICRSICSRELILFNDFQLGKFYDFNSIWLDQNFPFDSPGSFYSLVSKLKFQMPRLFGYREEA